MQRPLLDIVVPTFNNEGQLVSMVSSLFGSLFGPMSSMVRLIIVNNGHKKSVDMFRDKPGIIVLDPGENLRWEGGLNLGLEHSTAPFVAFSNDDVRFLMGQKDWLWRMLAMFNDPKTGAVGPCSNVVMGPQNMFADISEKFIDVKYLIGFFMVLRREALDKAGGVDDSLPGGDDIDLSIRLREAGYRLVCRRDIFVYHHGFQTGKRVHGDYWNSNLQQDRTNNAIIKKHGMRKFYETMVVGHYDFTRYFPWTYGERDIEGELCAKHVPKGDVLELGCGGRKTVDWAIGLDLIPHGTNIPWVTGDREENGVSQATMLCDVSTGLPVNKDSQDCIIARHLLEHCQDTLGTLALWNSVLRLGGKLVIAVPNQELGNTILQNPEHLVTFTPSSLDNLAAVCGFTREALYEDVNGVSFVAAYEKTSPAHAKLNGARKTVMPQGALVTESV